MITPEEATARGIDIIARAAVANTTPPILYAPAEVVAEWVLVPRRHLRTIQGWAGEIDDVEAIIMCAEILADFRLLGDEEEMGRIITDEINADPGEVRRLRESIQQARAGETVPWREAMPELSEGPGVDV